MLSNCFPSHCSVTLAAWRGRAHKPVAQLSRSTAAIVSCCRATSASSFTRLLLLAQAPTLLTQRQHGISLECLDVLTLQLLIVYGYFAHSFAGLRLELTVVEVDQLVAEAVNVAAEPSLPRQHVIVVVDILVQEGAILQLFRRVVRLQLTFCQRRADR